jgi:hypothetical protein
MCIVDEPEAHAKEMGEDLLDNFIERWPLDGKKRRVYADEVKKAKDFSTIL